MDIDLVGLAFAAGSVAALNPCGFAMLPAYLGLVVRGERPGRGGLAAMARALAATTAMAAGFVAVFASFGLLTVAAAAAVQRYLPYVTVTVGIALVALGIWCLAGREVAGLMPSVARRAQWAPGARLGSMFTYGVSYAVASLSCTVGPFLAVTGAGLGGGSAVGVLAIYGAYTLGFVLVVGVLAVAAALASSAVVERIRRIGPYLNRISGGLLVIVGLYVGYYGLYEVRLFTAGGSAQDPVIAAAARVQGALAGWVHRHGAWPWLVALAVLVVVVVAVHRHASRGEAANAVSPGSRRPADRTGADPAR